MTTFRFIGKRILQMIPVMLGVTFLAFLLLNLLPGDAALTILGNGNDVTKQGLATLQRELGLNKPLLERYFEWLVHALTGNFGTSLTTHQSVLGLIQTRFPVTLELIILAFLIAICVSILFAILAAHRPRRVVDRLSSVVSIMGLSMPNFVIGLVLVLLFSVKFRIFPSEGFVPLSQGLSSNLRYMALPAITMGFPLAGIYTRMLRADMIDQLQTEDYVVKARAQGISEWSVLLRHVLRNSAFGLITVIGVNFGTLMGATVIVETIFGLPGIGSLLVSSINNRDVTVVQGVIVILAVVVVLINLLADLLYGILDPRVRYGHG